MRRSRRLSWNVWPFVCFMLVAAPAAVAGEAMPAEGAWTINLDRAAYDGRPIHLDLRATDGRFTQAWATVGDDNAAQTVDASGLKCEGGGVVGDAIVNIDNVRHDLSLKTAFDADGAVTGTCRGEVGQGSEAKLSGEVTGSTAPRTGSLPVALDLTLNYALPGMTGAISQARLALVCRKDGIGVGAFESTTGRKPAPHWKGSIARTDLAYDGRRLTGKVVAEVEPTGFLWGGGGTFEIAIDATQVGNFIHGRLVTTRDGKEERRGPITGTAAPGEGAKSDAEAEAIDLVLAEAVDGREDLALHLEQRDGAFMGVAVPAKGGIHELDASGLTLEKGKLRGPVKIAIDPTAWGRGADRPVAATLNLKLAVKDGEVSGTYAGAHDRKKVAGAAAGAWESWGAVAARGALAPGMAYPRWRGPAQSGASPDSGHELVESLADMRLLWRSEADVPMSWIWGADPIGGIVGGFSSPLVADGRVYVFFYTPSGELAVKGPDEVPARDRGRWREKYRIDADDVFVCIDAATGRTLWKRSFEGRGINYNKSGGHGAFMMPCVADGRIYGIGSAGSVYAVDAVTGEPVWDAKLAAAEKIEEIRQRATEERCMPDLKRDFCGAPAVADGVVACNDNDGGLVGFDAATGEKLWSIPDCATSANSPVRWRHRGKEYFIIASDHAICIEPRTGKVLWDAPGASTGGTVAVDENHMICGSGKKREEAEVGNSGLSAYRIDRKGATRLWDLGPGYNNHVCSPVIYGDSVYGFAGQATIRVDLETGKIVGEAYFPGVRTCSSLVAADGRILRENLYRQFYFYDASGDGLRQAGPVWHPTTHAENTTSTMVDGRLFMRGGDAVYCYDMRKP